VNEIASFSRGAVFHERIVLPIVQALPICHAGRSVQPALMVVGESQAEHERSPQTYHLLAKRDEIDSGFWQMSAAFAPGRVMFRPDGKLFLEMLVITSTTDDRSERLCL